MSRRAKSTKSASSNTTDQLVPIELLCWCLDGPKLCLAVTGERWADFLDRTRSDEALAASFKRRQQLCNYFVAQLEMLTKLAFGRSYNVIRWLQASFS